MGKKVIPEQVEYFCDFCLSELSADYRDDFSISVSETHRDYSGNVGGGVSKYQACDDCRSKFINWMKSVSNNKELADEINESEKGIVCWVWDGDEQKTLALVTHTLSDNVYCTDSLGRWQYAEKVTQ